MKIFSRSVCRERDSSQKCPHLSHLKVTKNMYKNDGTKTLVYWQKEKTYIGPDKDLSV